MAAPHYDPYTINRGDIGRPGEDYNPDDYGADWQGAQRTRARLASEDLQAATGGNTAAQRQLTQGIGAAQRQQSLQAAGGGASAARQAMYQGADIKTQGRVQSDLLRAQESQAARATLMSAYGQQAQGEFSQQQSALQQYMQDQQRRLDDYQRGKMGDEADVQRGLAAAGYAMSAVSDERAKVVLDGRTGGILNIRHPKGVDYVYRGEDGEEIAERDFGGVRDDEAAEQRSAAKKFAQQQQQAQLERRQAEGYGRYQTLQKSRRNELSKLQKRHENVDAGQTRWRPRVQHQEILTPWDYEAEQRQRQAAPPSYMYSDGYDPQQQGLGAAPTREESLANNPYR